MEGYLHKVTMSRIDTGVPHKDMSKDNWMDECCRYGYRMNGCCEEGCLVVMMLD